MQGTGELRQSWRLLESLRLRNDGGGGTRAEAKTPRHLQEKPELLPWADVLSPNKGDITVMMHVVIAWANRHQVTPNMNWVNQVHWTMRHDSGEAGEVTYGLIVEEMQKLINNYPEKLSREQLEEVGKLIEKIGWLVGNNGGKPARLQAWYVEAYIAEVARENSEIASGSRQKRELGTWSNGT